MATTDKTNLTKLFIKYNQKDKEHANKKSRMCKINCHNIYNGKTIKILQNKKKPKKKLLHPTFVYILALLSTGDNIVEANY